MQRTGFASLPLHGGKAPAWLTGRMRRLAKEISAIIIDEYGTDTYLARLSDPYWFQAFGCVLGYDWHSSGVTTVVTGVLKTALSPQEHGIAVCGGKGKTSKKTPTEITETADKFGFSENKTQQLTYTSKMTAKIDNTAIQAGYQLYHHAFFVTEKGKWAVIQQGMNPEGKTARRYHWLSDTTTNFVVEPHNAIVCDTKHPAVLNMTAKNSEGNRKASVDLAKEPTRKLMRLTQDATVPKEKQQTMLSKWLPEIQSRPQQKRIATLYMPRNINWTALAEAYEIQPSSYEELLAVKGVGPATVRGLALVAELVYGEKPSWQDPVKYSFAYGGKDGVPYPVNRQAMDQSISILREAVQATKVGDKEKTRALQGLRRFVPLDAKSS
ncbi:MAG: DUF763 domain-containing protein [Candidatus Bathyarchaeota archaeon]|nr:DUF763 domain-containing protein [Candidatus Bathyarchaeota archaeon]